MKWISRFLILALVGMTTPTLSRSDALSVVVDPKPSPSPPPHQDQPKAAEDPRFCDPDKTGNFEPNKCVPIELFACGSNSAFFPEDQQRCTEFL